MHAEQRCHHGVCMSVRTRLTHASSAANAWKGVACPETPCATRPAQPRAAPAGGARTCITTARMIGRVGGGWDTGDLPPDPVAAGFVCVVRRMLGRYTTPPV